MLYGTIFVLLNVTLAHLINLAFTLYFLCHILSCIILICNSIKIVTLLINILFQSFNMLSYSEFSKKKFYLPIQILQYYHLPKNHKETTLLSKENKQTNKSSGKVFRGFHVFNWNYLDQI